MHPDSQQQRKKQEHRHSPLGMTNKTAHARHLLWAVALIGVVSVGVVFIRVARERRFTLQPGQSQLMRRVGHQLQRHHAQVFLTWDITETNLPAERKRFEGVVRWNASSGAANEPVIGMPVVLYHANPVQRTLTPIAYTLNTTDGGRFVIEADSDLQTLLGGFLHRAKNIPVTVRAVLESHHPPAIPTRQDSPEGVPTDAR